MVRATRGMRIGFITFMYSKILPERERVLYYSHGFSKKKNCRKITVKTIKKKGEIDYRYFFAISVREKIEYFFLNFGLIELQLL